jgi:hypothetical protein
METLDFLFPQKYGYLGFFSQKILCTIRNGFLFTYQDAKFFQKFKH